MLVDKIVLTALLTIGLFAVGLYIFVVLPIQERKKRDDRVRDRIRREEERLRAQAKEELEVELGPLPCQDEEPPL